MYILVIFLLRFLFLQLSIDFVFVLYYCCNIQFFLSLSSSLFLLKDFALSEKFSQAVRDMPGGGLPVVGQHSGMILEYPDPFPGYIQPTKKMIIDDNRSVGFGGDRSVGQTEKAEESDPEELSRFVSEGIDFGHRHFSGNT